MKRCRLLWVPALLMVASSCYADSGRFPTKPVQVILTSTPGSTSDVVTRFLSNDMQKSLGQPLVIMTKASVTGTTGADFVRRAPKDGYRLLLLGGNTTMSANVFLVKNLSYDPVRDFEPVSMTTINPLILVVRSDLPIESVRDLIAYAKARPGKLNYGVGNAGARVSVQMLMSIAGLSAQDIAFAGASAAMLELAAGRLDFMITDPAVADTFIKQGKVRPLAVTSSVRLPSMPELPTMAEAGVDGYDYSSYLAFYAPHGTPPEVIAILNAAVTKAIGSEQARAFFSRMAMIGKASTPKELAAFQQRQTAIWGRLVKEAGLEPQ